MKFPTHWPKGYVLEVPEDPELPVSDDLDPADWASVTVITCSDGNTADKIAGRFCKMLLKNWNWPAVPPDSVRNRGNVVMLVWETAQVRNPDYAIRSATLTPGSVRWSTHEIKGVTPAVKVTYSW